MRIGVYFLCLLLWAGAALARSGTEPGFVSEDWELVCDNTRTCRAAGYQPDEAELSVSVLLTRAAGPQQAVSGQLRLGQARDNETLPNRVRLELNSRLIGYTVLSREGIGRISPRQLAALLSALRRHSQIAFVAGPRRWSLSARGAAAVLLKMDESQGRVGTRGALYRRGRASEKRVLPPLPAPIVQAASLPGGKASLSEAERTQLRQALRAGAADPDCENLLETQADSEPITLFPLAPGRLLASTLCWRAAYNEGYGFWVINAHPPFAPQLITVAGSHYHQGVIRSAQKGRGVGDCWAFEEWVWTARGFVPRLVATTGMCRAVAAGGTWLLPTWVTRGR